MKKSLTLFALIFSLQLFSQDSLKIIKIVDEMTDKSYILPSKKIVVHNSDKTKGFSLSAFIEDDFTIKDLKSVAIGFDGCSEKDELIIMFEDSTKIKVVSFASFDCKGNSFYTLNDSELDMLATKRIKKLRLMNGRTFDNYTSECKNPTYFIELFSLCKQKKFILQKK